MRLHDYPCRSVEWQTECYFQGKRKIRIGVRPERSARCGHFTLRRRLYRMIRKILSLSALVLLASATFGHADTIKTFTLTADACTGGCGSGPFGTIKLDETATGVTVTETLISGETYAVTGAGKSLEFELDGA